MVNENGGIRQHTNNAKVRNQNEESNVIIIQDQIHLTLPCYNLFPLDRIKLVRQHEINYHVTNRVDYRIFVVPLAKFHRDRFQVHG